MKLDARRAEIFLQNPSGARAVLLYGEDTGLVREYAATLVRVVSGGSSDPFRVAELNRESHSRIMLEMTALCLTGGRRTVWVREATDSLAAKLPEVLATGSDSLLILETGSLPSRSKLRTLFEQRQDTVAIACYREDTRSLGQTITSLLAGYRVSVEPEALSWLTTQLGSDRGLTRQELEKLVTSVAPGGSVDLKTAAELVGDYAGLQLDDAMFAAMAGDVEEVDRGLEQAIAEGATAVSVLRVALAHLYRLQRMRAAIDDGLSLFDAIRRARPFVVVRQQARLSLALRLWTMPALAAAGGFIADAERACKRTGAPAELLCKNAVLVLARSSRTKR